MLSVYEQRQLATIEQNLLADRSRWGRSHAGFAERLDEQNDGAGTTRQPSD